MADEARKLTEGENLEFERLLEYIPYLREMRDKKVVPEKVMKDRLEGAAALREFKRGDVICEEGEFGSTAYFLVKGRVQVSIQSPLAHIEGRAKGFFRRNVARIASFLTRREPDPSDTQDFIPIDAPIDLPMSRPIAELSDGELIGEMTCRNHQPRSATVIALEPTTVVEVQRIVLDMLYGTTRRTFVDGKAVTAQVFKGSDSFRKVMDEKYRARSLANHLRGVPIFGKLPADFLQELIQRVELVSFFGGDVICQKGDLADAFYLIRSGQVKVAEGMAGGELVRTYLSKGNYFGEIGLIVEDRRRTATCTALDAVDLVKIPKEIFYDILNRFPDVAVELREVASARLKASAALRPVGDQDLEEYLGQGLFQAQNLLLIDLNSCTRCDACVTACAEAHDGVTRLLRDGLRYDRYLVATACRSCHDPLCMTQCPVGSIRRKDTLEIIIEDWCIGCTNCAKLCPFGNINMHEIITSETVLEPQKKETAPAAAAAKTTEKPATSAAEKSAAAPKTPPAATTPAPTTTPAPAAAAAPAPATPTPATPAAPAPKESKPAEPAKPSAPEPPPKMVKVRKQKKQRKAVTCDLCSELLTPSCVYACPHDAARRVDPKRYFAGRPSNETRKRSWISRLFVREDPLNRTTH